MISSNSQNLNAESRMNKSRDQKWKKDEIKTSKSNSNAKINTGTSQINNYFVSK